MSPASYSNEHRRRLTVKGTVFSACLLLAGWLHFPPAAAADETLPADEVLSSGLEAYRQGDIDRAIDRWRDSVRMYEAIGHLRGQADSLRNQATAYRGSGHFRLADERLTRAIRLAEQAGDRACVVAVYADMGALLTLTKQWESAETYLEQALALADEADGDMTRQRALTLQNLGNLHLAVGRYEQALERYHQCVEAAHHSGHPDRAAAASANAAAAACGLADFTQARWLLDQAHEWVATLPDNYDKAHLLTVIGVREQSLLEQSLARGITADSLRAYDTYRLANVVAQRIGDKRTQSAALGQLARLYESAGRIDEALVLTRRAIIAAQQAGASDALHQWRWQAGRLLNQSGQLADAILAYRQAADTLGPVRHDVATGYGNHLADLSYRQEVGGLYFELADLLLTQAEVEIDPRKVHQCLLDAQQAVERFKVAELVDYFQDECIDLLQARESRVDKIASGTAVIYVIPLKDRTEILLGFQEGLTRVGVAVGRDALNKEAKLFRWELENVSTLDHQKHARQLYRWLIEPIEQELVSRSIDTLVFVPDGTLRSIPIGALHDGQHYLIQRYATAVTPGLTLTEPRPLQAHASGGQMLAGGISQATQGYRALDHVSGEIEAVASLFKSTKLLDEAFEKNRIKTELQDEFYSIVHIATHGQFGHSAKDTFLLTYDGRLMLTDLEKMIHRVRFRKQPLELITLSACQTAKGDDRAALGLAGIGLKAGARSAVATLWSVRDRATAELLTEFYQQLRRSPGLSKAKALRRAKLKLLKDWQYDDPFFWSPFLLVGNWL